MYKLKFTRLQNEIFRLLCVRSGDKLNQRQIAKFLGASPTGIAKAVPLLEKEGLIKVDKSNTMNLNYIWLDRGNPKAVALKRAENLKLVFESELSDFLEEKFPGCAIMLFGSYATGEDTVKSDIDIAVIGCKPKNLDLTRFEKIFEREIIIQNYQSLKEINKELRESILNGIVLGGRIEL